MDNYSRAVFFSLDKHSENANCVSIGAALRNSVAKIFLEFGDKEDAFPTPSPTFYISLEDAERIATELSELAKTAKVYYSNFKEDYFEGEDDAAP